MSEPHALGAATDKVLLARAYLSRVAEPTCVPLWRAVRQHGPVAVADAVRRGDVDPAVTGATVARAARTDPHADLDAAQRRGIRLLTPETDEWPHSAFAALEAAGERRLVRYEAGDTRVAYGGELIPPLALWVRGHADLRAVGYRSVALVGSRSATEYGRRVAGDLGYGLAGCGFEVVSGGAYGIDATAHRGALAAGGCSIIVSAGGVDEAYPPSNSTLFDQVADRGLVVSESPPGCAPHRGRFLTRNRIIAALGTGTVVVEAARRSGALNTAAHCRELGRVLMAVPGPVTSVTSAGCHALLGAEHHAARLVTGVADVVQLIGSSSDVGAETDDDPTASRDIRPRDRLDATARRVLEGFPARGPISIDRLVGLSGVSPADVLRSLPALELHSLVRPEGDGRFRLAPVRRRTP